MDFEKLFSKLPQTMVVVSADDHYRILTATDAYLEVTMRRLKDLVGKPFLLEAFPDKEIPYEQNPVKLSLDRALATRQVDYLEVIRYDLAKPEAEGGSYETRYWEASHTPVLDDAGQVIYLIQHTSDVTARELARQAQQESEAKFRFVTDAVPELIYTADAQGQTNYVNQRWLDYTGLAADQLMGTSWKQVIHPEDLPLLLSRQQEALAAGSGYQVECRIRDKEGHFRWHLTRNLLMKNEAGQLNYRVGSSTDIHDTKKLVEELLASNEQMSALADQVEVAYRQAESRRQTLERLINESPAFFCVLKGPEHRYELVNEKYQQLFPNRLLVGRTVAEAVPEVIEQGFIGVLDQVYQTGKTFIAEKIPVKLDQLDSGKLEDVYLTFNYQALYEGDHIIGILVFGYEVTEEVKYQQKLKQMGLLFNE
ncbi:MAG: PAS domain-containing protein [Adhaeribacter sp.]